MAQETIINYRHVEIDGVPFRVTIVCDGDPDGTYNLIHAYPDTTAETVYPGVAPGLSPEAADWQVEELVRERKALHEQGPEAYQRTKQTQE